MNVRDSIKLHLPHCVVQEDGDIPNLSQQHMSQEACWKADVQYQDAGKKIKKKKKKTTVMVK
jgi:hypothetical protein